MNEDGMGWVKKIQVKAVLWGLLVDLLATQLCGAVFAGVFIIESPTRYAAAIRLRSLTVGNRDIWFVSRMLVLLVFVAVGGYFAGKMAKKDQWLQGALVGAVVGLTGFIIRPFHHSTLHGSEIFWLAVGALICLVPVGILGGVLSVKKGTSDNPAPDPHQIAPEPF